MAPRLLLSLALCAVALSSATVEDTSVMVQSRKAARSGLDLDQPIKEIPDVGSKGVMMKRLSASGEAGAVFQLNMPPFCDAGDQFGPIECAVYWGQVLNSSFNVHLKDGIHPGDIVSAAYTLQTESFNTSSLMGMLVPKHLYASSTCQFCEGRCQSTLHASVYRVSFSSPTTADNETICAKTQNEDLILEMSSLSQVGRPPMDLGFVGNATIAVEITDRQGAPRVAGSYAFTVGPNAAEFEAAKEALDKQQELSAAQEGERPMTLLELVRDTAESTVANALSALHLDSFPTEMNFMRTGEVVEQESATASTGPNHVFILNITLRNVESNSGSNLTVWYDKGCQKLDAHGSIACRVPLGELVNSTVGAGIYINAEEGSTMWQRSQVSLGGTFGILMSAMLEPTEYTLPLCGDGVTTVVVNGNPRQVNPPKCGAYDLELQTVDPTPNTYMDFGNIDLPKVDGMPFLPRKVDYLMPVLLTQELELKHKDNSSIAFLSVALGLDKA